MTQSIFLLYENLQFSNKMKQKPYRIEYLAISQKHVSFDFKIHDFILPTYVPKL